MTILGSGDLSPRHHRGSSARLVVAVIVLVLLAGGGYAAFAGLTGGSSTKSPTPRLQVCPTVSPPAQPSDPSQVRLVVLNGTATSGLAARVSTQLRHRGFRVSSIGNTTAPVLGVAAVVYGPGKRLAAQAVADQIDGAVLAAHRASGVELDLGSGFHHLATAAEVSAAAQRFVAAERSHPGGLDRVGEPPADRQSHGVAHLLARGVRDAFLGFGGGRSARLLLVTERLSAIDVSFLYMETATTAMHVGSVARFEPPEGAAFDYEALCALVSRRISLAPRYRQKVRWVPGHVANPVWVDDEDFDISYHVRRSALPKPGNDDQLRELVGRLQSRQLDRSRPLWEMYLVEGLSDGRFAIVTKTHHAMVDGISAVDIATLILDVELVPRDIPADTWVPHREPSRAALLTDAVVDTLRRPTQVVETVRSGVTDVRATANRVLGAAAGVAAVARTGFVSAPRSPLNADIGEQRRFGMAATSLADYKAIRQAHGGTINDVVLATVAGALRTWLLTRGEAVVPSTTVRAMVPVSIRTEADQGTLGNRVSSYFVDLPVGEPSPLLQLRQVSVAMDGHKESGQSVGAEALVRLGGFAPPTILSAAARLASGLTRRIFNVVVTNVPGPQFPLYAAGARMIDCYPVVPLAKGQAVTIGLISYDGGVFYGMNCDRDSMPDIDVLAGCIEESLAALLGSVA